jgi:hypothetical protein
MKSRLSILAALAVSVVLLGASRTYASVTVSRGDYVSMSLDNCNYYVMQDETGGEFAMSVYGLNGIIQGTVYTFCADPNTLMYLNQTYCVNKVTGANWLGYKLSDYGKWIYYAFSQDVSSPVPGHTALARLDSIYAGAIQEGIWSQLTLDGQTVALPTGWDYSAYNTVAGNNGQDWYAAYLLWMANPDNAGLLDSVEIAQLQYCGQDVQNQMVLSVDVAPNSTEAAPEPSTIIIWSVLGWLGISVGRRCRRTAA